MPVSFSAVARPDAQVLILGSLPGVASLVAGKYYAHPRNAFWPIMGELFGIDPAGPYAERLTALQAAGVALWDVVAAAERPGSLDAAIVRETVAANDFSTFFAVHRGVRRIVFNGTAAETLFRRQVLPALAPVLDAAGVVRRRAPSTSPAHASLSFADKCAAWAEALAIAPMAEVDRV